MNATAAELPLPGDHAEMQDQELLYKTLFEASTDAIFVEMLDGRILDCNRAACRMFGYTREEFLQLSAVDLVPPEMVEKFPQTITQDLASGGVFIETFNRRKDSHLFPVEVNAHMFPIGHETRVIVFVRDMTEQKKAEKIQEALYRISEAAHMAENPEELYPIIHTVISELMPARNFYIALYDPAAELLSFPYYADEVDEAPPPQKPGQGLTEYILQHGQPLLATPEVFQQLLANGQVETIGADSVDWLGVPLVVQQKIFGVMAVQTYDPAVRLSRADQDVLEFVSRQVAMSIERKQAEKARRESEDRYRTLFETAPVSIFLASPQGDILDVNQITLDMIGSPSAQATQAINLLTFPLLIQAGFSADFQRCIDSKVMIVSDCPYTSKWGKTIYMHYFITPILDGDGEMVMIQVIVEDITERKKAEQALQESDARARSILETSPDIIYQIDPSMKIQYINHVLEGLSKENIIGSNALDFVEPEFRQPAQAEIDRVFEHGEIVNYTTMHKTITADLLWFETNIGPIFDIDNHVIAATLVSRDVTERKVVDEKIRLLNLDLERQAEQLTFLYEAGLVLNRILDPHEQLETLAQITIQALHADNSGFFRYDPKREEIFFEFGVGIGIDLEIFRDFRIHIGDEQGLVGWIAQQRKPFYLPDVFADPRWIVTNADLHSALWVPVEHEDHLLGVLSVTSARLDAFTPADQQLLLLFANQLAISLENGRLYQTALDAAKRSTALHWASQEIITAGLDPERIYKAIHQAAIKLMPAEAFIISALDEEAGEIDLRYAMDHDRRYPSQRVARQRGLSGTVISLGKTLIINDVEKEASHYDFVHFGEQPYVRSVLAAPMRLGDKILGVVSAQSYQPQSYTIEDSSLLEILAAYAAIALENSRLFNQMETSNKELGIAYEEMLESWSRALEMRDKETKGHSDRVTRLSLRLARAMGMPEADISHFRRGVLLHDIGKMAIPDSILLKPSALSEDEWIFMRQHPSYAHQMLANIPFIRKSLDVPYCHHEKWDGSGYPRGLKGEAIPLGARIFAVVDVWDALINDRPYRPGWLPEVVRSYIEAQSGIFFDPRVVAKFLEILDTDGLTF